MPSYLSPGVYIEEVASGSSSLSAGATAIAAFVGYTEKGPKTEGDPHGETPTLVSSWADFQSKYGGPIEGAMLPHAVYGWFSNDGGLCYIARVLHEKASTEPGQLALPATAKKLKDIVEITSKGAPEGMTVNVTVNNEIDPDDPASEPTFDLTVLRDGQEPVTYEGLSVAKASPNFAATKTKESELITVTVNEVPKDVTDLTLALPKPGNYPVKAAPSEPLAPKAPQFIGSETARRGINGLALREDVTIVMVPDLVTAAALKDDEGKPNGKYDLGMYQSVQTAMITHCEQHGNRMAILDPPPGLGVSEMATWREDVGYSSAFATLYYPNIMIQNPLQKTAADPDQIMVPPCGHVAGLWARTDSTRGVWKAPANDTLRGLLGLERNITMAEQTHAQPGRDQLHPPVRHPRHPRVGCPHARRGGWRLALHQRPPAVQHDRDHDHGGHAVGRLRAERHEAVGGRQAHAERVPAGPVARRRAVRGHGRAGVLRQVRRGEQPPRIDRRGQADRRGRDRPGEAGRVRHLPHQPVQGRGRLRRPTTREEMSHA